jgi:hypothetical protein
MALLIQKLEIMNGLSLTNVMIWRSADEDFICDFQIIMYSIIVNKLINLVLLIYSFITMIVCHPNNVAGA